MSIDEDVALPLSFSGRNAKRKFSEKIRPPSLDPKPDVAAFFDCKFEFQISESWRLPQACEVFTTKPWKISHLQTLKNGLNFQKSRLNDYDIVEWSPHTRKRNIAGCIKFKIATEVKPEFLTQAWTKFFECASAHAVIPDKATEGKALNTLHLCEAPGAFVASLNHFLKLRYRHLQWQWMATSLNPYHEGNSLSSMICDDRFLFHTLDNWYFGSDFTGNLMDWTNSQDVIDKAKTMGEVHFITADGSIDCMLRPDAQEETVAPLHFCEVITALQTLTEGGTLIFKLFTIFEHLTINLLYIVAASFKKLSIFKPVTSKQGNSEVYAVCTLYRGVEVILPLIERFKQFYGTQDMTETAMFSLDSLPASFIEQIHTCAYFFYNRQCQTINDNILTYDNPHLRRESDLKRLKYTIAIAFFDKYKLSAIQLSDEILKGLTHKVPKRFPHLRSQGSFTERAHYLELSLIERMNKFKEELYQLDKVFNLANENREMRWIKIQQSSEVVMKLIVGKPVDEVNSSKFVYSPILFMHKKLKEFVPISCNSECFESGNETCILRVSARARDETFDTWEKSILDAFSKTLRSLNKGSELRLENYNLFTQFSVGVLYIVALTCFKRVGFGDGLIRLDGYKGMFHIIYLFEKIRDELCRLKSENDGVATVLGVLPVDVLCCGDFYDALVSHNNNDLYVKCFNTITSCSEKKCDALNTNN